MLVDVGLWVAVAGLILFAIGTVAMRRRHARPAGPAPEGYAVTISEHGRAGTVDYAEDGRSARFDWEFAGAGAVAFVMVPTAAEWTTRTPFGADRRDEVLRRVADEVVRQKCPGCTWTLDADTIHVIPKAKP